MYTTYFLGRRCQKASGKAASASSARNKAVGAPPLSSCGSKVASLDEGSALPSRQAAVHREHCPLTCYCLLFPLFFFVCLWMCVVRAIGTRHFSSLCRGGRTEIRKRKEKEKMIPDSRFRFPLREIAKNAKKKKKKEKAFPAGQFALKTGATKDSKRKVAGNNSNDRAGWADHAVPRQNGKIFSAAALPFASFSPRSFFLPGLAMLKVSTAQQFRFSTRCTRIRKRARLSSQFGALPQALSSLVWRNSCSANISFNPCCVLLPTPFPSTCYRPGHPSTSS